MLGLIDRFLNERAEVQARLASDAYGGHTFAPARSVRVRWHTQQHLLRSDAGREIISDAHISLTEPISVGDRVVDEAGRQREVVLVRVNRSTRGVFSHYVAYLA